jgi:hypothetical protein
MERNPFIRLRRQASHLIMGGLADVSIGTPFDFPLTGKAVHPDLQIVILNMSYLNDAVPVLRALGYSPPETLVRLGRPSRRGAP